MIKSRLKRLAEGKQTLYHVTNSQLFLSIVQDGQLRPGSETGVTSFGSTDFDVSYSLFDSSIHSSNQQKLMSVSELKQIIDSNDDSILITDELKKEVEDNFQDNPSLTIEVAATEPQSGQPAVYLSSESGRDLYRSETWSNRPYENYPALNTELKVEVEVDNLGPDTDDGGFDPNKPTPPWKQTLDTIGQCVYYGSIPLNKITGVYIDDLEPSNLDDLRIPLNAETEAMIYSTFDKFVTPDTWLGVNEANNQLLQFYGSLNEVIEQILQTANRKSRLKKLAHI
jgi:hypothetical protein